MLRDLHICRHLLMPQILFWIFTIYLLPKKPTTQVLIYPFPTVAPFVFFTELVEESCPMLPISVHCFPLDLNGDLGQPNTGQLLCNQVS
uniref:Uncharacterized protein n=1 Tax=Pyxicephalus adspersus TaxID=30357 RepID=A0AAV3AY69_PYXAD|nr:TPA: hypothetical protein GDO54_006647 [Pyxicephalus adspersus]